MTGLGKQRLRTERVKCLLLIYALFGGHKFNTKCQVARETTTSIVSANLIYYFFQFSLDWMPIEFECSQKCPTTYCSSISYGPQQQTWWEFEKLHLNKTPLRKTDPSPRGKCSSQYTVQGLKGAETCLQSFFSFMFQCFICHANKERLRGFSPGVAQRRVKISSAIHSTFIDVVDICKHTFKKGQWSDH